MKFVRLLLLLFVGSCFLATATAQQSLPSVPRLVNFSGRIGDAQGKAVPGMAGVTFAIYKDQYDGAPLWMETQNVQSDPRGNYTVQLGATRSEGLPLELFTSGEARWLGVRVNGQEEQPRVLLLSVPYALKAADAATIGGLPPSAFVLAPSASAPSAASNSRGDSFQPTLGGSGTLNFVPLWTPDGNTLGNSALFQSGTQMGINTTTPAATLDVNGPVISRGLLQLPSTGTANAGAGFSSQPFALQGSSFNSGTQQAIGPVFQWQTEPAGNNTANPAGTLNLLYGTGSGLPSETGLNIASNGRITFATGQTFPGTGTITGITAGTGLTGGGTSGNVTLSINVPFANQFYAQLGAINTFTKNQIVNANLTAKQLISTAAQGTAPLQVTSTTQVVNLNASLLGGLSASAFQPVGSYAGLGANTFTGDQSATGNVSATGTVNGGVVNATTGFNLGGSSFAFGSVANSNAFLGFSGNSTMTGNFNAALGVSALQLNTTGFSNTATGDRALQFNTTGTQNTATGTLALLSNDSGSGNTADGDGALELSLGSNNTAIGGFAFLFNSTGSGNSALGYFAGVPTVSNVFTTGTNDTYVGIFANSGPQLNLSNAAAIGALAQVTASNAMVLGSINGVNGANADTSVGIGTTAPTAKLDVRGTANFGGLVTFTNGQPFPGTGTITGVTAGTDLTGGGASGGVTLNLDTTKVPQLAALNTFGATQTISNGDLSLLNGNLDLPAAGVINLGGTPLVAASLNASNTSLGFSAANVGSGADNTAVGRFALQGNTAGVANTAIGATALHTNTADFNTAIGFGTLQANTTGASNTAVGPDALLVNTTGSNNVGVGSALTNSISGSNNTGVGNLGLGANTTGSGNTAVGDHALVSNITGSNNTALGAGAGPGASSSNLTNATAIGASAQVTASNSMVLGSINGVNGATANTNVGIGTTAPVAPLQVVRTDGTGTGVQTVTSNTSVSGNSFAVFSATSSAGVTTAMISDGLGTGPLATPGGYLGTITTQPLGFITHNVERMRIAPDGKVGIGTNAPDSTLSVNGSADKTGGGSWGTFSDRRLKNLDGNFDAGLSQILKLRPIRYRYKEDNALGIRDHDEHVGFVAQDVQKVIPEAVTENSKGYLLVNNDPILWTMLNAIKEQQQEIAALRAQLPGRTPSTGKVASVSAGSTVQSDLTIRGLRRQVNGLKKKTVQQTKALQGFAAQMLLLETRLASLEADHKGRETSQAASILGHR
jgi:hypothetical protein